MMRKEREIIRVILKAYPEKSFRAIAEMVNTSHNTIRRYQTILSSNQLNWEKIGQLSDQQLADILHPEKRRISQKYANQLDFQVIHQELSKRGVTLMLLWDEFKINSQSNMSYTTFTRLYNDFAKQSNLPMLQEHKAGERVFVDYSGLTMKIYEPPTFNPIVVQVFVGVLGASDYAYAEASYSQKSHDWIYSTIRMFEHFGAVPHIIVPDNLKSAVVKSCPYDPVIHQTYQEMARHYNIIVFPARARQPKDKAKVENGVKLVQNWILARLRNDKCTSLAELNEKISLLLEEYNNKKFQKIDTTRRKLFEEIDLPMMQALPPSRFEIVEWLSVTIGRDYHVRYDKHAYSVPYQYAGKKAELKISELLIEVYCEHRKVAGHVRSNRHDGFTRIAEHMPKSHQMYAEQNSDALLEWATKIGPFTLQAIEFILKNKPHPEMGYKACLGLKKAAKTYTEQRLEKACQRALLIRSPTYSSIVSILKAKLDQAPLPAIPTSHMDTPDSTMVKNEQTYHENIRGKAYYSGGSNL